jgi:hypothetical protein
MQWVGPAAHGDGECDDEPTWSGAAANRPWEPLVRPDEAYVTRCWEPYTGMRSSECEVEELLQAILTSGVQAVSIQYNFNFFTPASLKELLQRLRRKRIVTTVTMHAKRRQSMPVAGRHKSFPDLMEALKEADFCIYHRQSDVDAMEQSGVKNVLLRQQGIVSSRLDRKDSSTPESCSRFHFVISCFGFFLPRKAFINSSRPSPWRNRYSRCCASSC